MPTSNDSLDILFVGDICVDEPIAASPLAPAVAELFGRADYAIGNLEGPIIKHGTPPITKAGPHKHQKQGLEHLVNSRYFYAMSLANNHSMDYGQKGLANTMRQLDKAGIEHFGAGMGADDAAKPLILRKNGVEVAVVAACEAQFGCNMDSDKPGYTWLFSYKLQNAIRELSKKHTAVIVFAHGGLEHFDTPLAEFRDLYKQLVDCGASAVIATHPHVVQGKEIYKGAPIYYSIGNFFFNRSSSDERWNQSLTLRVRITNTGTKAKLDTTEYHTELKDGAVDIAKTKRAKQRFASNSALLHDQKRYLATTTEDCVTAWHRYYKEYYGHPVFNQHFENLHPLKKRLVERLTRKFLVGGSDIMLYHNIRIETHRFAVQRAIEQLHNVY